MSLVLLLVSPLIDIWYSRPLSCQWRERRKERMEERNRQKEGRTSFFFFLFYFSTRGRATCQSRWWGFQVDFSPSVALGGWLSLTVSESNILSRYFIYPRRPSRVPPLSGSESGLDVSWLWEWTSGNLQVDCVFTFSGMAFQWNPLPISSPFY